MALGLKCFRTRRASYESQRAASPILRTTLGNTRIYSYRFLPSFGAASSRVRTHLDNFDIAPYLQRSIGGLKITKRHLAYHRTDFAFLPFPVHVPDLPVNATDKHPYNPLYRDRQAGRAGRDENIYSVVE